MKYQRFDISRRRAAKMLSLFASAAAASAQGAPHEAAKENSRVILEIFDAIERRDEKRAFDLFDPALEMHWPPSLPYGGSSRGLEVKHPNWGETWNPFQPTMDERRMDPRIIGTHGNEVAVLWRQRGVSPGGERFDGEVIGLYQIRRSKLTRAQMFYFDTAAVSKFLARARQELH